MNNEYQDIKHLLKELQSITPDSDFVRKMESLALPAHHTPSVSFFPQIIRFAFILLLSLFFGGTGVVLASIQSHHGDLLFPIKQAVEQVTPQFIVNPTPTPIPSAPTPTETPTPIPSQAPSPQPKSTTPTPTPMQTSQIQTTPPAQSLSASVSLPPLQVALSLGSQPSPTPSQITGSKDNEQSRQEASLLPEIHVNVITPIIKIGL